MKSNIIIAGTPARVALMALVVLAPAMALFSGAPSAPKRSPRSGNTERHCVPVGGTIMTNFGAIDPLTNTLGPATGDLRGAVSATLLGAPQPGAGGTVVFHVQHHWVTESGDTITFDPAVATAAPLSSDGIPLQRPSLFRGTGLAATPGPDPLCFFRTQSAAIAEHAERLFAGIAAFQLRNFPERALR
jgi:hypothetical protein